MCHIFIYFTVLQSMSLQILCIRNSYKGTATNNMKEFNDKYLHKRPQNVMSLSYLNLTSLSWGYNSVGRVLAYDAQSPQLDFHQHIKYGSTVLQPWNSGRRSKSLRSSKSSSVILQIRRIHETLSQKIFKSFSSTSLELKMSKTFFKIISNFCKLKNRLNNVYLVGCYKKINDVYINRQ